MSDPAPSVAVVAVGDELLSGEIEDTNFPWIAGAMQAIGVTVVEHMTVADDESAVAGAIERYAGNAEAIVFTGGLGPTSDDITCAAVALATGRSLVFHEHVAAMLRDFFRLMGREMDESNLKQAYLPEGAVEIPAAGGTAPGFMLEFGGSLVVSLPGVPREMKEMLSSHVIPALERRLGGGVVTKTRRVFTFGAGESDIAGALADIEAKGRARYGYLAQPGTIMVKVTASGASSADVEAILEIEVGEVAERLGDLVYSADEETMEEVLCRLLRYEGKTLATAESCTGGLVAGKVTNVPGSSEVFLGGVVVYGGDQKEKVLGIPASVLTGGTVNREVARLMAVSVREMFGADIGVSVTGVAGPSTGGESKPVGTVCLGLAHEGGENDWEVRLPGDRTMVRSIATQGALNAVRLHLLGSEMKPRR